MASSAPYLYINFHGWESEERLEGGGGMHISGSQVDSSSRWKGFKGGVWQGPFLNF
jgi:hypothetical protein